MADQEAIDLLDSAMGTAPEAKPAASATAEEMYDYYLGDKANKLPSSAMFAFKDKGQIQKIPASQVINGYRINQKTSVQNAELLKSKSQWEMSAKELENYKKTEDAIKPYRQLQDWSVELETKNPVGYKYLMDQIDRVKNGTFQATEDKSNGYDPTALNGTIVDLRNQLKEVLEWKSQFVQEKESQKIQEDQKFVNGEIENLQKQFKEINLDELDENQIPLKTKVIDFGVSKGFQNFTDAYRAFFFDKLADILVQRGRTEAVNGLKKDNANGIVARSSTPFTGHPIKADNDKSNILAEFESILHR